MATFIDLANRALGLIGQDQVPSLVTSLNNKTVVAINACLDGVAESVLRARDWNCARRRATLAAITNESLGEWAFAYATPTDCLAVRRFVIDGLMTCPNPPQRFSWEMNSQGKRILYCNHSPASIVYTFKNNNPERWDGLLQRAFVGLLASELACSFAKDVKLGDAFAAKAFREFDEAVGVDEAEGEREIETSELFVNVRYG